MADAYNSARMRWIAVVLLTLLYSLNALDRYVVAVVIEPLRHEFGFSDTQLGAIGGLAHSIAFGICVLPLGWLFDRVGRVKLLSGLLAVWSVFTALAGFATGFWTLFLSRMGVGAAEAGGSPGTQSLLASIFPVKSRASAMGVVFSGTAIGTGLVFAIGGPVAQEWGWRYVFLLAGVPGLILALVMWLGMPEPARHPDGAAVFKPLPMRKVMPVFFKTPPLFFSGLGSAIAGMTVSSTWVWITPILIRQQDFSLAEAGAIVGVAAGVVKFLSGFASGFLGDWIAKGQVSRLWIVPTIALALSAPISFAIAFAPSQPVAVGLVMLLGLALGTHYAAPRTVLMTVASPNIRGSVASLEQFLVAIIGGALGPLVTGAISDYLGGDESIGLALAATVSFNVIAALCFWVGMRHLGRTKQVEAPAPAT